MLYTQVYTTCGVRGYFLQELQYAIEDAVPINFSDYSTYKHKLISDLQIGGKYNGYGSLVHRLHARTRDM